MRAASVCVSAAIATAGFIMYLRTPAHFFRALFLHMAIVLWPRLPFEGDLIRFALPQRTGDIRSGAYLVCLASK